MENVEPMATNQNQVAEDELCKFIGIVCTFSRKVVYWESSKRRSGHT
jgi:hypothetical protein